MQKKERTLKQEYLDACLNEAQIKYNHSRQTLPAGSLEVSDSIRLLGVINDEYKNDCDLCLKRYPVK